MKVKLTKYLSNTNLNPNRELDGDFNVVIWSGSSASMATIHLINQTWCAKTSSEHQVMDMEDEICTSTVRWVGHEEEQTREEREDKEWGREKIIKHQIEI